MEISILHKTAETAQRAMPVVSHDALARAGAPRSSRSVAYLVNVYPKISHSFIRTEIAALERLGIGVSRFTIRRSKESFTDAHDGTEAERTLPLLDGNWVALAGSVSAHLLRKPITSLRTLLRSLRSEQSFIRALAYFAEASMLAREMERQHIRHVHVHFGTNPVAVARLAARLAPITYSFTAHGPDEFDAPRALDLAGKIADAAFAVGVSSFGRSQLMRWSKPEHWDRIKVVRCAVAPHFLTDNDEMNAAFDGHRLVCVARLSAQKGLPILLTAAARIAATHKFVIDVIGDGEGQHILMEQIRALKLENHVRLLGWQSSEDVHKAISSARAFVLPSFAEGLPVVLMEALALGRPTITTAIAGIPELVDASNGWVVPAGSVDALATALKEVLETPSTQLRVMGEIGRRRVQAFHHPDHNARHLANLLTPFL